MWVRKELMLNNILLLLYYLNQSLKKSFHLKKPNHMNNNDEYVQYLIVLSAIN